MYLTTRPAIKESPAPATSLISTFATGYTIFLKLAPLGPRVIIVLSRRFSVMKYLFFKYSCSLILRKHDWGLMIFLVFALH